jgi:hypothetical protein
MLTCVPMKAVDLTACHTGIKVHSNFAFFFVLAELVG